MVVVCALMKVHEFSGCDTRPASLAPAGSISAKIYAVLNRRFTPINASPKTS
jgi:hypothetical protein